MFSSIFAYNTLTNEQKTAVWFGAAFDTPVSTGSMVGDMVAQDFRSAAWPQTSGSGSWGSSSSSPTPSEANAGGGGVVVLGVLILVGMILGGSNGDKTTTTVNTAEAAAPVTAMNQHSVSARPPALVLKSEVWREPDTYTSDVKRSTAKLFIGKSFSIHQSASAEAPILSRSVEGGLAQHLGQTVKGWHKIKYFDRYGYPVATGFVSREEWSEVSLLSVPLGKTDKPVAAYVQENERNGQLPMMRGNKPIAYMHTGEKVQILKRSRLVQNVLIRAETSEGPVVGEVPAAWLTNEPVQIPEPTQQASFLSAPAGPLAYRDNLARVYYREKPYVYGGRAFTGPPLNERHQ